MISRNDVLEEVAKKFDEAAAVCSEDLIRAHTESPLQNGQHHASVARDWRVYNLSSAAMVRAMKD